MQTADIAVNTILVWADLSGRFIPLRSAAAQMIFFNTRSPRSTPAHAVFRPLRSVFRSAHVPLTCSGYDHSWCLWIRHTINISMAQLLGSYPDVLVVIYVYGHSLGGSTVLARYYGCREYSNTRLMNAAVIELCRQWIYNPMVFTVNPSHEKCLKKTLVVTTQMFMTKTKTEFQDQDSYPKPKAQLQLIGWKNHHILEWSAAMKMMIYWSRYNWSSFNQHSIQNKGW